MTTKINIWLDCDPGNDDAFAIVLAGHHPKINLLGISTAAGNTSVENTAMNACKILYSSGIDDVVVVKGASAPLIGDAKYKDSQSEEVHGKSGLGTNRFPISPITPLEDNAIVFMYQKIMKCPSKVKIVGTGALTNISLLLKVFPDVKQNIDEIVFMGGAITVGNITPCAEFNMYCDPEAAEIVLQSGVNIVTVPLEVTLTTIVPSKILEKILELDTEYSKAFLELLNFYSDGYRKLFGFESCPLHDPCAIAYVIAPELFLTKFMRVEIERASEKSKGRTICDQYGFSDKKKNVHVATKMDVPKFWSLMLGALEIGNAKSRMSLLTE